ncbi:AAA family ATPase [Schaalia turicensis]|uniref:AAA family ATPase n=1 Tax=Schaalia turicensis TaxID=131111 RepID=UPI003FA49347
MFRKIDRISDYQFFQDFRWSSTLPNLEKISLIYGPNGSGKTTLSSLFTKICDPTNESIIQKVNLEIENGGHISHTNFTWHDSFSRIHVLSDEYIRNNQSLDAAEGIDMPAILTIGKRSIEKDKQLKTLRPKLSEVTEQLESQEKALRKAASDRDEVLRTVSDQVVANLARAGGHYKSKGTYNIRVARTALNAIDPGADKPLSDEDLAKDTGVVNSDKGTRVSAVAGSLINDEDLLSTINKLLIAQPAVVLLDTLKEHPEATSWVQDGQALHINANTCLYCGGPLKAERSRQIAALFSGEVTELQKNLRSIREDLIAEGDSIASALTDMPNYQLISAAQRSEYKQALAALEDEIHQRKEWRDNATRLLTAKLENVLAPQSKIEDQAPIVDFTDALQMIDLHNTSVDDHLKLVQEAAGRVEKHLLLANQAAYVSACQHLDQVKDEVDRLTNEQRKLSNRIQALEMVEGDPLPSAEKMTHEVARMLGRNELSFELNDGRYRVTRNGAPVKHLSKGEQTAIIAVHFFESVARASREDGDPIVIIDDPVSSLDSSVFMGVSTYIWTEAVTRDQVEQLILLTHNFELFRQWDIQIDGLHKGPKTLRQNFPAARFELKSSYIQVNGKPVRYPVLSSWPSNRKLRQILRSNYVHGFSALVDAHKRLTADPSLEAMLDAQLLYPNVMRRVLETFLAFRYPNNVGDFTKSMRESVTQLKAGGYSGDAEALRTHLTRFSHAYSHRDTPDCDDTVPPEEMQAALQACFRFIHGVDKTHFSNLCAAIEADESSLLGFEKSEV